MSSFEFPNNSSHGASPPQLPPLPANSDLDLSPSDPADEEFQPEPTSGRHTSDIPDTWALTDQRERREIVQDRCQLDPECAKEILGRLPTQMSGWCRLCSLKPSKDSGYIQVSSGGANKFAVLQWVVLWAAGDQLAPGEQCSHLCHQPACSTVGHVCSESGTDNNGRKGCLVWVNCHHCSKKMLVCMHSPMCIKFCEGYSSMEDFVQRGVCRVLRDDAKK